MTMLPPAPLPARIMLMGKHFPSGITPPMIALLDDVERLLANAEAFQSDAWSNASCQGYIILAAQRTGLSEQQTGKLVKSLHRIFDEVSLVEAAKIYRESGY